MSTPEFGFIDGLLDGTDELLRSTPRSSLIVQDKVLDGQTSPVTQLDTGIESLLVARIRAERGKVAFYSEEFHPDSAALGEREVWVIDPVDNTRKIISGHPFYSTNVAAIIAGEVYGWTSFPAFGWRVTVHPTGVWFNGHPVERPTQDPRRLTVALAPGHQQRGLPASLPDGRQLATVAASGLAYRLALLMRGVVDAVVVAPGHGGMLWDYLSLAAGLPHLGMAVSSWQHDIDLADLRPAAWSGGWIAGLPGDRALLRAALSEEGERGPDALQA